MATQTKTYTSYYWKTYKMRELLVRSLSGILYVSLILSTLFFGRNWALLLFGALGILTLNEFLNLLKNKSYLPYLLLFISFLLLYIQEYTIFAPIVLIASCIFNILLAYQLFKSKQPKYTIPYQYGLSFLYLISGFIFMTMLALADLNAGSNLDVEYSSKLLIAIFLLIWANDSFAYLVGVNFGKRKLFPSVSPKKSIEGFIGGLVGAILVSIIIAYKMYPSIALAHWIVVAILASSLGTIGDLIQSKLKRRAGVKDSGKIMPGHGGMYDRLDSIIYTSPFIYAYLYFVI